MPFYLAFKEIWRMRGRYVLFSLVIALITILVLFIAALAGGLANANKQFIEKLNADMLVYQANVDLQPSSSRLGQTKLADIRRVDGVKDLGPLGLSSATIIFVGDRDPLDISLVGVEPGKPGDVPLIAGTGLLNKRNNVAVIDIDVATSRNVEIGDRITIKTIQGTQEVFYQLEVAGITDARQYFFQPVVILPLAAWSKVRPQPTVENSRSEIIYNIIAVQLQNPDDFQHVSRSISSLVDGVEIADKNAAILALPGYTAQQSTLNTQQVFTLLIGMLVVGGFFQIQTLQKVAQIGVLKAIGSPSTTVAMSVLFQIILVTLMGVSIGSLGTLLLAFAMPNGIPITFTGPTIISAISLLLFIGPIGGLISIRLALKIDPLMAMGLSS